MHIVLTNTFVFIFRVVLVIRVSRNGILLELSISNVNFNIELFSNCSLISISSK